MIPPKIVGVNKLEGNSEKIFAQK